MAVPFFYPMQLEKIEDLIGVILNREFQGNPGKQIVYKSGNRLNFSCPYCGDSHDAKKKRGNFYLDTLSYKCYNGGCGIFKDSVTFLKDFGLYNKLTGSEKEAIKSIIGEQRKKKNSLR